MEQRYVVLRSRQPATRRTRGGPRALPSEESAGFEGVDIASPVLTDAERADVARDPQVTAVAAAMPLALVEPVESVDAQPAAGATWGLEAIGATASPFDGSGLRVAVLDTGIDLAHPAFAGIGDRITRRNFTDGSEDDVHGHGTHCAGTVFGQDVDGTRIGVARGIERALIGKVLGEGGGTSATIVEAIQWALAEGANVVSMSLGIDFPGYVDYLVRVEGVNVRAATSLALAEYRLNINLFNAVADLVRAQGRFGRGSIVVAASGNESERPSFTIAVAPPAAGDGIVSVGAIAQGAAGFTVADFSNTEVDVSAPGVGVISARAGGGLVAKSGTSMATPHVAGTALLWAERMLAASGTVDAGALLAQVVARADPSGCADGFTTDDFGTGVVQAPTS